MTRYDKLVRDLIPDIIRKNGTEPIFRLASEEEYAHTLRAKLQEEVAEYLQSGSPEELADIMEVVYALGAVAGHDAIRLESIRRQKADERGGFGKRIILEEA